MIMTDIKPAFYFKERGGQIVFLADKLNNEDTYMITYERDGKEYQEEYSVSQVRRLLKNGEWIDCEIPEECMDGSPKDYDCEDCGRDGVCCFEECDKSNSCENRCLVKRQVEDMNTWNNKRLIDHIAKYCDQKTGAEPLSMGVLARRFESPTVTAIELIAAERQRQIEQEGWTTEHDQGWKNEELAQAAACYALPKDFRDVMGIGPYERQFVDVVWPFGAGHWKPSPNDRKRELVKAAALIAAEIDRLEAEEGGGNGIG